MFLLQLQTGPEGVQVIDAMLALVRRGLPMLRAKRVVEALLADGRAMVDVPVIESVARLAGDLAEAGIVATPRDADAVPDVRALRERLQLSREQFALRFGLEIETVRNWETGRRAPDTTARSYLRVIAAAPELIERVHAAPVSS